MGCHGAAGGWRIRRRSNLGPSHVPDAACREGQHLPQRGHLLSGGGGARGHCRDRGRARGARANGERSAHARAGPCRQADRAIDWQHDTTVEVLRKIDSADGMPGLTDSLLWQDVRLFDAHEAHGISGEPGTVVAQCDGALARATVEGAVWIGHVRSVAPMSLKLAATKSSRRKPRICRTGQDAATVRSNIASIARLAGCNSTSTTAP